MSESPVFSRRDADRILARASELDGAEDGRQLSVTDVRGIAGEAGFGRTAIERAIAEALESGPTGVKRTPVEKEGLVLVKMWTIRTIPVELTSDQLLRVVRIAHHYREGVPRVSLEDRQLTWKDRKGIIFHLSSTGGETEVRVRVSRFLLRRSRMMRWIRLAADRLESLIYLVAARDVTVSKLLAPTDES